MSGDLEPLITEHARLLVALPPFGSNRQRRIVFDAGERLAIIDIQPRLAAAATPRAALTARFRLGP
jgi:hypothetical protein